MWRPECKRTLKIEADLGASENTGMRVTHNELRASSFQSGARALGMSKQTQVGEGHQSDSRMVVVHLITCLLCGGSEKQLQQVILASDHERFRHIVIQLREDGPLAPELRAAGIEVHSLGMRPGFPSLIGMMRLVHLLRNCKPDLLHCWLYHACLMGLIGGSLVGVPRILWGLRTAHLGLRDFTFMTRCVIRLCASLSGFTEGIVVNSEASALVHRQLGYSEKRLRVIPNGVDLKLFSPDSHARASVREELGLSENALLVGMVARFDPMKDHGTFVHAASIVAKQYPNAHFLLAGEGIAMENTQLARMLDQNGVRQKCHLLGQRFDIARLTAALDVACLSSWTESSPNVVIEAMASAVPCVVTDVGDAA